jgi:hypothetical protein
VIEQLPIVGTLRLIVSHAGTLQDKVRKATSIHGGDGGSHPPRRPSTQHHRDVAVEDHAWASTGPLSGPRYALPARCSVTALS